MVAVLLGKPSRGPIHPDYVPSIFSFQKTTQSVPSTRYLRAVRRSRTRSALISKCSKQPSAEVKGENGQGDDAIDLTDTVEGESENEAVASCSTSTETVDEIMDGGISRDLAGAQVVVEEITQLNENTSTMDEDLIEESTEDMDKTVQVESKDLAKNLIPTEMDENLTAEEMSRDVDKTEQFESRGLVNGLIMAETNTDLTEELSRHLGRTSQSADELVENFLDDLSPNLDEAQDNELMGDLNLREIEEEYSEGMATNVDETRCDELGEPSLQDTIRVLAHELELKEIEIGELQIENERLTQQNMLLTEENFELRNDFRLNAAHSCATTSLAGQQQMVESTSAFGTHSLENNDKKVLFYTGLPSYKVYERLFNLLQPLLSKHPSRSKCSLCNEFLLVLMKLRLGVPNQDLAYRFNISSAAVSSIFHKWINVMSVELNCLIPWPDAETLRRNMPVSFRKHYSKVKCIIDCFEIFIERPTSFEARAATYSNYKKHNTVKVFIAITPTGSISFISQAWGGRVSDKEITRKCGFLDFVEYGDDIMADRGFNVADDLALCGARLLIPAYTRGKQQLSTQEVEETRQLARVRIHIERVIGQMRKKYKILHNTLPISLIKCPSDSCKNNCTIDRILIVTSALTNLSPPVIPS